MAMVGMVGRMTENTFGSPAPGTSIFSIFSSLVVTSVLGYYGFPSFGAYDAYLG